MTAKAGATATVTGVNQSAAKRLSVKSMAPPVKKRRSLKTSVFRFVGWASLPVVKLFAAILGGRKAPPKLQLPSRKPGDTKFDTPVQQAEAMIKELERNRATWAATPFGERAKLAYQCAKRAADVGKDVAATTALYKGAYEWGLGEEMLLWAPGVYLLNDIGATLEALQRGKTRGPVAVDVTEDGQAIADVFPMTAYEHLVFGGYHGSLWITPGEAPRVAEAVRERQGGRGEVALILGAGNANCVVVGDIANRCIADGCCCVVKLNPVNEYIGPYVERAFEPLVTRGVLRFVYGGAEVGKFLCSHPLVESVHITGSDKTFDAIVWGGKPKVGPPPYEKPITAELGCVTPVVVVPGGTVWTSEEIHERAQEVVASVACNASCNCASNKLLVTSAAWPQREQFLAAVHVSLQQSMPRACFYPGSTGKYEAYRSAYPDADPCCSGAPPEGHFPFLMRTGMGPKEAEHAFREEPWSTVISEVALKEETVPDFLAAAAAFCNESVWGTLSASVYIHPEEEAAHAKEFHWFLRDLRYGLININAPSLVGYLVPRLTWGAHPGHTVQDIGSGIGQVRNSLMVDNVQKSVLRAPWRPAMKNLMHLSNCNMSSITENLGHFFAAPSLPRLVCAAAAALQG